MNRFEGLMNAHPRKRYKSFAATAADTETVWLECDPTQLVPAEPCSISVWPEEMFASAVCPDKAIYFIEVHEFCELLIANPNRLIRIFPNGKDQQVDTTADVLLADIKEELDLVE